MVSRTEPERIASLEAAYQHLATKADVAGLRVDIESVRVDIESIRSELRTMRWFVALGISIGIAITSVIVQLLNNGLA